MRFVRAGLLLLLLVVIHISLPTHVSAATTKQISTSTAETIARKEISPPEDGGYTSTYLLHDSKGIWWYLVDFYQQPVGDKHYYYRGRAVIRASDGAVAKETGEFADVYAEFQSSFPIIIADPATQEVGYYYTPEDASVAAGDALMLTPDYSVATSTLLEGPTQYYYVIDFIRYDQYSKKFYWGKRAVVDPYTNTLILDPAVLAYFHARTIDVPEGYDPLTKEKYSTRTIRGDALSFISSKLAIAVAIGVILILVGLSYAIKRSKIRVSQTRLIDIGYSFAILLQLSFAFYLAFYGNDTNYTYISLIVSAVSTIPFWIWTRSSVAPKEADDLVITPPNELPKFADVGGMESVKEEIRTTIGILMKYGPKASSMGLNFNGILLYGPPGVGKTYMARAIAGEYGMNFIGVKVSDITSSYMAGSTQLIASVFKKASKSAPCLLFFDEFDSVAQQRGQGTVQTEDTRIVNQLLRSLEDVRALQGKVIVMAATNDKNKLDDAVIRPGRFDRHIMIPMPDQDARAQIIAQVLRNKPVAADVDTVELAKISEGMSAAEISTAVEKALFSELNTAMRAAPGADQISISNQELVSAFRNLYAREKQTVKKTTWDDLILSPETTQSLKRLVKLIEDPDTTAKIGIEPPRGVLLYGPPGTGKTTIARVIANEANASFVSINASDIFSKWLGESEQNIKKIFEEARRHKPSIIFMDEIDAIMKQRGAGDGSGRGTYGDDVTNQILQEIDGVKDSNGVFVIGATNNKAALDSALLRGGRLSEQIEIPLPELDERKRLFDLYLKKATVDTACDKNAVASAAVGLSGADIKSIAQQAILAAYDRGGKEAVVTQADLINAVDKVTIGPERKFRAMTEAEKKNTAYHEAGHALVASVLTHAAPVDKITIVSRGHALGYTARVNEDKVSSTRAEFIDEIAVSLGGYIAEKLIFGDISTGASNDLQKANQIARMMVTQYGMSEQLGAMISAQGAQVDEEVRKIIEIAYKSADEVMTKYRPALDGIAQELLLVETLDRVSFEKLLAQFGIQKAQHQRI